MKLKLEKHDWENYYPVHCKHCLWTGNSEFVYGDEDGPFYCPYCNMPDPTENEFSSFIFQWNAYFGYGCKGFLHEAKELVRYLFWRALSVTTQPVRSLYTKYVRGHHRYWMALNREITRYWSGV